MSLASPNVRATYDNVHGEKAGQSSSAATRNRRLKVLEAYGTIPHDHRAPAVVQKADADLAQQEREMGNDVESDPSPANEAGSQADGNDGSPDADASTEAEDNPGPFGISSDAAGPQAELSVLTGS